MIDLCSGEPLPDMSALAPTTELVDGSNMTPGPSVHKISDADREDDTSSQFSVSSTSTSTAQVTESSWTSMTYVSKMGRIVLFFETLIFLASVAILFAVGRVSAVLILYLIFVQPFVILYYFYWRKQRDTVQLDALVKLFATGFFVTTFQSWVFEQLIETIGIILFAPWIAKALTEPRTVDDDIPIEETADGTTSATTGRAADLTSALISRVISMTEMGTISQGIMNMWRHVTALTGWGESNSTYPRMTSPFGDSDDESSENNLQAIVGRNWFAVLLACFFLAFCVAAAVEETMKQFIVRCHRFATAYDGPAHCDHVSDGRGSGLHDM